MKEKTTNISNGAQFLGLLFLLFLGLKLGHVIEWSWWWIFSPIWIPLGLATVLLTGAVIYELLRRKNEQQ